MIRSILAAMILAAAVIPAEAEWTRRFADLQNSGNAGDQSPFGLTADSASSLVVEATIPTRGQSVNATPLVTNDLLFFGDWGGHVYVVDLPSATRLIDLDTGASAVESANGSSRGVQSVPTLAALSDGSLRVFVAASKKSNNLWCLDLSKIVADRDSGVFLGSQDPVTISPDDTGNPYLCGSPWPISILAPQLHQFPLAGYGTHNGSPLFVAGQEIWLGDANGNGTVDENEVGSRDVLFTPTNGYDCVSGEVWAVDAVDGTVYWSWDPVVLGDGLGGVIWHPPAMNVAGDHLYVTTGNCTVRPAIGEMAESLVALDPVTGGVKWHHQRRLVDSADLDIGNAPSVADVEGEGGCHVVVSPDKDGCLYGFPQTLDPAGPLEPGFDPLRPGQQRMLWRTCLVGGSLYGGFNASGSVLIDRYAFVQSGAWSGSEAVTGNANGFALDVCTGDVAWATAAIRRGLGEGAGASGMWFQPSGGKLEVFRGGDPDFAHLATVHLPGTVTPGGGGPAVVAGKVYVPLASPGGIAVIAPGANPDASAPVPGPPAEYRELPFPFYHWVPEPEDPFNPYEILIDIHHDPSLIPELLGKAG